MDSQFCDMAVIPNWIIFLPWLLTHVNGVFQLGPPMTFCDSRLYCERQGGRLPLTGGVTSLQRFMAGRSEPVPATWAREDDPGSAYQALGVSSGQLYCVTRPFSTRCPGLVVLQAAVSELHPPLVNCAEASVKSATCGNGTHFTATRISGQRTAGSFCNVTTFCEQAGLTVAVEGEYNKARIRNTLDREKSPATWMASGVGSQSNGRRFCRKAYPGEECPGKIILHTNLSVVSGDIIGCDVTLPVVCDLPSVRQSTITTTTSTFTDTTDTTTYDHTNEISIHGEEVNSASLPIVFIAVIIVVTVLMLLAIIALVVYCTIRKRANVPSTTISIPRDYETLRGAPQGGSTYTSLHTQVVAGSSYEPTSLDGASVYYSTIPDRPNTELEDSGRYDYISPTNPTSTVKQKVEFPDECSTLNRKGADYLQILP